MIPSDVLAQLNSSRGRLGQWLPTIYPSDQLILWAVMWRQSTPVGQEVAAEEIAAAAKAEEEAKVEAERLALETEEQERQRQVRLAEEEQWRLPAGTEVLVRASQTFLDGRVGKVHAMELVGDVLMADVTVDPLPADHPLQKRDLRHRPLRFMPVLHRCRASELSVVHCSAEENHRQSA